MVDLTFDHIKFKPGGQTPFKDEENWRIAWRNLDGEIWYPKAKFDYEITKLINLLERAEELIPFVDCVTTDEIRNEKKEWLQDYKTLKGEK